MSTLKEYTEQLTDKLSSILGRFERPDADPGLKALIERWQAQLQDMRAYAKAHNSVSIAFVGGTGTGKSTLINALLGTEIMPTHSFRTCTSAAIEIAYAQRKTWQAHIQFLPLSEWEAEKQAFLDEVQLSQSSGHSSFDYQDFLYKAWALYRPQQGQPPMPFPLEHLLELLREPLPESITEIVSAGACRLRAKDPLKLRAQLQQYLTAEASFWPLVQQVHIVGPAEMLKDGLRLIDLPGLNDPNPVREHIARTYLRQSEFIWLIFGTGRGLTREVVDLIKDQQFINQIVLDGKVSALSFVGTRADEFVPSMEKHSLNLPEDTDLSTLLMTREQLIVKQVQQQLSELTLWFSNRYKVSAHAEDILRLISSTLQQSPIFLCAALSSLLMAAGQQHGILEDEEQTGIPRLKAHMRDILAEHGTKAQKKRIRSQFQDMNTEILRLVKAFAQQRKSSELSEAQMVQLETLRNQSRQQLNEIKQELKDSLRLKKLQFEKQLLFAFSDLLQRQEQLSESWQALNWQYLTRAVQQGGRYTSVSTGIQLDLGQDILNYIENEVALDWYDYFQRRLLKELELARSLVAAHLDSSEQQLKKEFAAFDLNKGELNLRLQEQSQQARRQLEVRIQDIQLDIRRLMHKKIQQALAPVLEECAQWSGEGLKQRILVALGEFLQQFLPQLGKELQGPLNLYLESLSDAIQQYQQGAFALFEAGIEEALEQMTQTAQGAQSSH